MPSPPLIDELEPGSVAHSLLTGADGCNRTVGRAFDEQYVMKTGAIFCGLVFVFVTGCSTDAGSSQAGHPPAASPSPTAVNPAALSCRLPVTSPTSDGQAPGGWVTFPAGDFARDPASLPGRLQTDVPSYDRAISGWVPVSLEKVAPDGSAYVVHNDPIVKTNGFYMVDARTGARRLITAADGPPQAPGSWAVVDYASAGIYLWSVGMLTVPGLWLLDPQTGNVRLVNGSHFWSVVAGGAAWAIDQPGGAEAGTYNALYRLDLASGQVSIWYQTKGNVRLLSATPDGEVLITEGDGYGVPEVVRGPKQISALGILPGHPSVTGAYNTNPGTWLSLQGGGLALYIKGIEATVVSNSPDIFNVAGGCW